MASGKMYTISIQKSHQRRVGERWRRAIWRCAAHVPLWQHHAGFSGSGARPSAVQLAWCTVLAAHDPPEVSMSGNQKYPLVYKRSSSLKFDSAPLGFN